MLLLFGLLFGGFLIGYFLRNQKKVIKIVDNAILISIFLLLFFLGISVGTNSDIVENLNTLALEAIAISAGAIGGSVILSFFVYKKIFKKYEK